jgi:hypothetical protein
MFEVKSNFEVPLFPFPLHYIQDEELSDDYMSESKPPDYIAEEFTFSPHRDPVSPDQDNSKDESESEDMCPENEVQNG